MTITQTKVGQVLKVRGQDTQAVVHTDIGSDTPPSKLNTPVCTHVTNLHRVVDVPCVGVLYQKGSEVEDAQHLLLDLSARVRAGPW